MLYEVITNLVNSAETEGNVEKVVIDEELYHQLLDLKEELDGLKRLEYARRLGRRFYRIDSIKIQGLDTIYYQTYNKGRSNPEVKVFFNKVANKEKMFPNN